MKKSFGARLRDLRGHVSQAETSNKIGISSAVLSSYECDTREPSISTICRMCEVFNCTADWLLGLSETQQQACAPPAGPVCPDCRRRDDQIDELFSQLRVMRAELEKKGGGSASPKPSSASGVRKAGA